MTVLVLPDALRAQLAAEAAAAFPIECCGLIEGIRTDGGIAARALHPMRNAASGRDRFEIDPRDHLQLQRAVRAKGTAVVGCYHSHPGGRPEPSAADRAGAQGVGFVWLIVGEEGQLGAYLFDGAGFQPLPLAA